MRGRLRAGWRRGRPGLLRRLTLLGTAERAMPAATAMIMRCLTFIAGMIVLPPIFGFDGVLWAGPLSDVLTGIVGAMYGRRMFVEVKKRVALEIQA